MSLDFFSLLKLAHSKLSKKYENVQIGQTELELWTSEDSLSFVLTHATHTHTPFFLAQIVSRVCEPGFLCRQHTVVRTREQKLQKIDTMYARPALPEDIASGKKSYALWTWAKQDAERNFSIVDVRRGVFNLPEKSAAGGRVYAMTATGEVEKRIWIGTAVSCSHNMTLELTYVPRLEPPVFPGASLCT